MSTRIKPERPDLFIPCPDCGKALAFYFDPCTGEEWYCEACAPACPACGKRMVRSAAGAACVDCDFWGLAGDGLGAA
jgi:hypothetical protein